MIRILEDRLIINFDESSFGRSIRNNYSWLQKFQNSGIIKTMWSGRLTLIWGHASNGCWICMGINMITTTEEFWIFMYIQRSYLDRCFETRSKMVTVTIDYKSIHLTKQKKSLWMNLGIELLGLPQNCPHLAPWELVFGMVKRILSYQVKYKGVDFSKPEGQKR